MGERSWAPPLLVLCISTCDWEEHLFWGNYKNPGFAHVGSRETSFLFIFTTVRRVGHRTLHSANNLRNVLGMGQSTVTEPSIPKGVFVEPYYVVLEEKRPQAVFLCGKSGQGTVWPGDGHISERCKQRKQGEVKATEQHTRGDDVSQSSD